MIDNSYGLIECNPCEKTITFSFLDALKNMPYKKEVVKVVLSVGGVLSKIEYLETIHIPLKNIPKTYIKSAICVGELFNIIQAAYDFQIGYSHLLVNQMPILTSIETGLVLTKQVTDISISTIHIVEQLKREDKESSERIWIVKPLPKSLIRLSYLSSTLTIAIACFKLLPLAVTAKDSLYSYLNPFVVKSSS